VGPWGASTAALLALSFGLAFAIAHAHSEKVGVAAAINPDAFSSLAGEISEFDAAHFPNDNAPDGLTFSGSMCAPGVTTC
jgi:hypothetical protein